MNIKLGVVNLVFLALKALLLVLLVLDGVVTATWKLTSIVGPSLANRCSEACYCVAVLVSYRHMNEGRLEELEIPVSALPAVSVSNDASNVKPA